MFLHAHFVFPSFFFVALAGGLLKALTMDLLVLTRRILPVSARMRHKQTGNK
jgi:hypothetical protein